MLVIVKIIRRIGMAIRTAKESTSGLASAGIKLSAFSRAVFDNKPHVTDQRTIDAMVATPERHKALHDHFELPNTPSSMLVKVTGHVVICSASRSVSSILVLSHLVISRFVFSPKASPTTA